MKALVAVAGGVLLALGLTSAASASARVGVLRCHVHHGIGYVIGSAHPARCVFTSDYGICERYTGVVKRLGLDLGYTHGAVVTWAVVAPSAIRHRALRGDYFGASADVSAGVWLGSQRACGWQCGHDLAAAAQPQDRVRRRDRRWRRRA